MRGDEGVGARRGRSQVSRPGRQRRLVGGLPPFLRQRPAARARRRSSAGQRGRRDSEDHERRTGTSGSSRGPELEQSEGIRALVDRSRASLIALHDRELADVERDRGRDREQMRGAEDAVEEAQENVVRLEQEVAVVRDREEALKGVIEPRHA